MILITGCYWANMRRLRKALKNLNNWQVLGILFGVSLVTSVISAVISLAHGTTDLSDWFGGLLQNFSSEMLGAFLTFVLLEQLVRSRQEKERLIRQMHSKDNGLALQAVGELGAHGWLTDGSLAGAMLVTANLTNVHMWDADLRNTDLHGASLHHANLQRCNLTGANLWQADLTGVRLEDVNLEGADLYHANMIGARLVNVEFDEHTRLPDGSKWTPQTDMTRYTDPQHPQFVDVLELPSTFIPRDAVITAENRAANGGRR